MDNSSSIPPNQTLYINHLNEKIKLDELKSALFQLCSQYGEVLEIVASKAIKKRGQAFVIFNNLNTAIKAKKELKDMLLFGKHFDVFFSKTKSDLVLSALGLLTQETKSKIQSERKKRRDLEYKAIRERIIAQKEKELETKYIQNNQFSSDTLQTYNKLIYSDDDNGRNSILFVEDLPKDIDDKTLESVFEKYTGFKEIRLHSGRGVCFVEYDNELNAESAMIGLSQMNMTNEWILNISFAKK